MGLFDSIRATLQCHVCGSNKEREIQTKAGPCLMLDLEIGDTMEPFFYGDYWLEESWHCEDCQRRMPEEERWHHAQTAFIHFSRDRLRYREALSRIRNSIWGFRRREETKGEKRSALFDIGPKTVDELLDKIVDDVDRAKRGEPVGLF